MMTTKQAAQHERAPAPDQAVGGHLAWARITFVDDDSAWDIVRIVTDANEGQSTQWAFSKPYSEGMLVHFPQSIFPAPGRLGRSCQIPSRGAVNSRNRWSSAAT